MSNCSNFYPYNQCIFNMYEFDIGSCFEYSCTILEQKIKWEKNQSKGYSPPPPKKKEKRRHSWFASHSLYLYLKVDKINKIFYLDAKWDNTNLVDLIRDLSFFLLWLIGVSFWIQNLNYLLSIKKNNLTI